VLQTPKIEVSNYQRPNYVLQNGVEAEANKIARLYIEPEHEARVRLKIPENTVIRESHYVEPGLQGIQKGIHYIILFLRDERENLPEFLKKLDRENFTISVGVIWKMDGYFYKNFEGNYDHIDYERDIILAMSHPPEIKFFFSNNDNCMIYANEDYLEHLNTIQKVLGQVAPGMFEADPMNREDLLEIGYLERKNRMHIIPNEERRRELEINEKKFYQNKNR